MPALIQGSGSTSQPSRVLSSWLHVDSSGVADRQQLNLRLDGTLVDQLKELAAAEGISVNALASRILAAAVAGPSVEQRLAELERRLTVVEGRLP